MILRFVYSLYCYNFVYCFYVGFKFLENFWWFIFLIIIVIESVYKIGFLEIKVFIFLRNFDKIFYVNIKFYKEINNKIYFL